MMMNRELVRMPHAAVVPSDGGVAESVTLSVLMTGPDPRTNPSPILLVFVHGFPELAFSWRKQLPFFARHGFSCIAPDCRGYGESSVPKNPLAYAFENVTQDLLHLVKVFKRERAVFIGHDFGGAIVWAMAQHYPRACLAVVGINTPLTFYDSSTLQMFEANGGPIKTLGLLPPDSTGQRDYVVYFQTSGDAELAADPRRTMLAYFRSQIDPDPKKNKANMQLGMRTSKTRVPIQPGSSGVRGVLGLCPVDIPRDPMWSEAEIGTYAKAFAKTGFPLAYYRMFDRNFAWDLKEGVFAKKIEGFPCFMLSALKDLVLTAEQALEMDSHFQDLTRDTIDCGHWTQFERPEETNDKVLHFLRRKVMEETAKL